MLPPEMKLGSSRRGTGVPALVAFMVLASVGAALAGQAAPSGTPEPSPSVSDVQPGRSDHQSETPGSRPSPSVDPAVTDACTGALEAGSEALEQQVGLGRAIEVILENCGKSPQAQGLLTALGRLEANQERQGANPPGGQPNEHANERATHDGGPPPQAQGSTGSHGRSMNASETPNDGARSTPASHR